MGNDVTIITGIIFTLIAMGLILPIFEGPLGLASSTQNTTQYLNVSSSAEDYTGVTGILGTSSIFSSIIKALFLYYKWMPGWMIALHVGIRLIGAILLIRLVRSGGG